VSKEPPIVHFTADEATEVDHRSRQGSSQTGARAVSKSSPLQIELTVAIRDKILEGVRAGATPHEAAEFPAFPARCSPSG
jgi:hypothetical protein